MQFFFNGGASREAVYGFKDEHSATFNSFKMFINETTDSNIKEFELLAGNDSPTGSFNSIGKFHTQNIRLYTSLYQEFKFKLVQAKYLKFRLISNYSSIENTPTLIYEFQLMGKLN